MAAEEAFVYAVDTLPEGADVRFEFRVTDDSIEIGVRLGAEKTTSDEETERAAAYATFILESVCDEYEFTSDESGAHLRLLKRAGSARCRLGAARTSSLAGSLGTRSTPRSCSSSTASKVTRTRATSSSRCT